MSSVFGYPVPVFAGLVLAACVAAPGGVAPTGEAEFRSRYLASRAALEAGDHERASAGYARLLGSSGPLEPQIRLEYAHALLRGGDVNAAAQEAQKVADMTSSAEMRASALAVLGTAQHEAAISVFETDGDRNLALSLLASADRALSEALRGDPLLDPNGRLSERLDRIRETGLSQI